MVIQSVISDHLEQIWFKLTESIFWICELIFHFENKSIWNVFYTTRTNQNFQIFERIISRGNIIEINFKLILKNKYETNNKKTYLFVLKSFCLFLLLLIVIGLGFVTIGWLLMLPIWVKLLFRDWDRSHCGSLVRLRLFICYNL